MKMKINQHADRFKKKKERNLYLTNTFCKDLFSYLLPNLLFSVGFISVLVESLPYLFT